MKTPGRLLSVLLSTFSVIAITPLVSGSSVGIEKSNLKNAQKQKSKGKGPSVPTSESTAPTKPSSSGSASTAAPELAFLSPFERELFGEINTLRTNPKLYATYLDDYKKLFKDNRLYLPNRLPLITMEGLKPVDEALSLLRSMAPLPAYASSEGMSKAAKERLDDMIKSGVIGHRGSDGSTPNSRLDKFGRWDKTVGEAIAYDVGTAREVILSLLVDDGVGNRGHRKNLLSTDFTVIGLASGESMKPHSSCIIDFAGAYKEKSLSGETPAKGASKSSKGSKTK